MRFSIEMRKILAAFALVWILAACGRYSGGVGSDSTPTPIPPVPSTGPGLNNFDVTATDQDHVAALRVGQRLLVVLHAGANMRTWSHPASSDTTMLAPIVDPAAASPAGVTVAAFQAQAPGQVAVTAISGPNCASGQACPMYAILYSLQVTITA